MKKVSLLFLFITVFMCEVCLASGNSHTTGQENTTGNEYSTNININGAIVTVSHRPTPIQTIQISSSVSLLRRMISDLMCIGMNEVEDLNLHVQEIPIGRPNTSREEETTDDEDWNDPKNNSRHNRY